MDFEKSKFKGKGKKAAKWTIVDPVPNDLAIRMSSQESMTSQMSMPSVPYEESILEEFFQLISQCDYNRARELVESEKDGHKLCYASSWGEILQCLSQLALAEKGYANLVYLGTKQFLQIMRQKDNLKAIFNLLIQEFQRMESLLMPNRMDTSAGSEEITSELLLAHISGQVVSFLRARTKMMEFYEQLSNLGSMKQWLNFDDLVMMSEEVLKTYMKGFHHPLLTPIRTIFSLECESLCHLLHAQIHLSSWRFLSAVVQLHYAHNKLTTWQTMVPVKEFGLYFHDVLAKQTVPAEMKANLCKAPEDFHGKLQAFQRKSDAVCILLVFDSLGIPEFSREGGYTHPDKYVHSVSGKDSFPPIFSYPALSDRPINQTHWPTILMMISSTKSMSGNSDIKYIQEKATDKKPLSSYFFCLVDPRMHLIVLFEGKKNEKDSSINSFLTEFSSQLKCLSILQALKQFART